MTGPGSGGFTPAGGGARGLFFFHTPAVPVRAGQRCPNRAPLLFAGVDGFCRGAHTERSTTNRGVVVAERGVTNTIPFDERLSMEFWQRPVAERLSGNYTTAQGAALVLRLAFAPWPPAPAPSPAELAAPSRPAFLGAGLSTCSPGGRGVESRRWKRAGHD